MATPQRSVSQPEQGEVMCVLLSCVGEQDPVSPNTNQEGSVLTAFRYLNEVRGVVIQRAYLFPTGKESSPQRHTEERAKECKETLASLSSSLRVEILPIQASNPSDLRSVLPEMRRVVQQALDSMVEATADDIKIDYHINVSSGTPQMKECWPFLASTDFLPRPVFLWQVLDPRGGATIVAERVRPAPELSLFDQERLLLRAEQYARVHLYGLVADELEVLARQPADPSQQEAIALAQQLCRAWEFWDRWEFVEARKELRSAIEKSAASNPGLAPRLLQQDQVLQTLSVGVRLGTPPTERSAALSRLVALDRYHTARRRLEAGHCPEAVTHALTVCELALRHHFREQRIDPDTPQWSVADMLGRVRKPEWLEKRGNRKCLRDRVDLLREQRNKIEHHGRPVSQKVAQEALSVAGEAFDAVFDPGRRDREAYPFNPAPVRNALLSLLQALRDGIWSQPGP